MVQHTPPSLNLVGGGLKIQVPDKVYIFFVMVLGYTYIEILIHLIFMFRI